MLKQKNRGMVYGSNYNNYSGIDVLMGVYTCFRRRGRQVRSWNSCYNVCIGVYINNINVFNVRSIGGGVNW